MADDEEKRSQKDFDGVRLLEESAVYQDKLIKVMKAQAIAIKSEKRADIIFCDLAQDGSRTWTKPKLDQVMSHLNSGRPGTKNLSSLLHALRDLIICVLLHRSLRSLSHHECRGDAESRSSSGPTSGEESLQTPSSGHWQPPECASSR